MPPLSSRLRSHLKNRIGLWLPVTRGTQPGQLLFVQYFSKAIFDPAASPSTVLSVLLVMARGIHGASASPLSWGIIKYQGSFLIVTLKRHECRALHLTNNTDARPPKASKRNNLENLENQLESARNLEVEL